MMIFKKGKRKEYSNYPHQDEIAKILQKMEDECKKFSTIIDLPTGAGKTKIATDFCVKALELDDNKVLWLSDSIDLLTQSIDRFKDKTLNKDISYQLVCGTKVSYNKEGWIRDNSNVVNSSMKKIELESRILFASVETIREYEKTNDVNDNYFNFTEWLKKSQQGDGKLYIVYDEVHHIGAGRTEEFFKELFEVDNRTNAVLQKYVLVGLTGTVYRYDSPIESFNRWFKYGWDNSKKCIVKPSENSIGRDEKGFINNRISVVNIQTLIDEGILIKPTLIRVDDFEKGMPEASSEMKYLAKKVADTYKVKKWNKTIIFVEKIESAKALQKELQELGIDSFAYTSDTVDDSETRNDIEAFKKVGNKNYKIMIAVDMVSEGFDVKDIETIYLYSAVQSQILLRQRIGRVLRKHKNKKKATVYWQKYFEEIKTKQKVEAILYNNDKIESEDDIQRDIGLWKKGMQLPAGMYLEKLPTDAEEEKIMYIRKEFLNMIELFGAERIAEGMDYFSCGDEKLYIRKQEKKGYEQFYYMIRADYWSCLIYKDKYIKFEDYAEALGVSRDELLKDIKVNCFYLANVRPADTSGKIIQNKRFIVEDNDIICFYEWVVEHDLKMPDVVLHTLDNENKINNSIENDENGSESETINIDEICGLSIIEEYMTKHPNEKKKDLIEAIQLQQKIKKFHMLKKFNKPKEYTEVLCYGNKNNYIYQQLCSAKAIMKCGAVFQQREKGILYGLNGELAFLGKDEKGKVYQIKAFPRTVNEIANGDSLFLSQALVDVPNRICVSRADVSQYSDRLWTVLSEQCKLDETKKDKITNEFIMALGYVKNQDDIIRIQCNLFGDDVPRILQYVIYCKIYCQLAAKVSYCKDEDLIPECQNKPDLEDMYRKGLEEYEFGGEMDDDLNPVEAVIEDYRPYVKAIPYYQGIKPEYLCRMLNMIIDMSEKKGYEFVDAFGGSGTITLNISNNLQMQQTYNDLGIFNKSFFDVLQDDKCAEKLKDKVKKLIDLIINDTGNNSKTEDFFQPYIELLEIKKKHLTKGVECVDTCINYLKMSIQEREDKYIEHLAGKKEECKEAFLAKKKECKEKLDNRLKEGEERYQNLLQVIMEDSQKCEISKLREIELHLHVMMLKIDAIFYNLRSDNANIFFNDENSQEKLENYTKGLINKTKVDLAFVFYLFNSMNKQRVYNSANISELAKFIARYENDIDTANMLIKKVDIEGKNALDLIKEHFENENIVWYHDIPYSETSAETYVDDWFDEVTFTEYLSKSAGDYIVASRFNICEKQEDKKQSESSDLEKSQLQKESDQEKQQDNIDTMLKERRTKKQYGLLKFFSRFVSECECQKYKDVIEDEYKEIAEIVRKSENIKKYEWSHVNGDKDAKYITFAFCQHNYRHHYKDEDKEVENKKYDRKVASLSLDSIRRMLKDTQFGNISVEIMITNMELDMATRKYPIHELESGVWYIPTFKTDNAYLTEPITIIMSYKKFYEEIILYILSNAYEEISHKEIAAAYRELYKNKYKG